jgi:RNA polymerase sigma factor (sigma-70 family)
MGEPVPVADLVAGALDGDEVAWRSIVNRYGSLVSAIARQHRLDAQELADVSQNVWLKLLESLGTLREPKALAGWLRTTTRNECVRAIRVRRAHLALTESVPGTDPPVEEELLAAERRQLLREAFGELPANCRELLSALLEDPPPSYAQLGARLGVPVGSVGPTRARCLEKLRRSPALRGLVRDAPREVSARGAGHGTAVE